MPNRGDLSTGMNRSKRQATVDQIRIVRRARGRWAQGDPLLQSSLRSLSNDDTKSALIALELFTETPDLSNQHRIIIKIAIKKLRPWLNFWIVLRRIYAILSFAMTALKLFGKGDPLNYTCHLEVATP